MGTGRWMDCSGEMTNGRWERGEWRWVLGECSWEVGYGRLFMGYGSWEMGDCSWEGEHKINAAGTKKVLDNGF